MRNRGQVIGALSIAVIGASVWIGLSARAASAVLNARAQDWRASAESLETVRREYRAPAASEVAVLRAFGGRASLGVLPAEKPVLVDSLARLAAAASLAGVRIAPVALAGSPQPLGAAARAAGLRSAGYSVAVDFTGGFAGAVKFVSTVPRSLSLSRFTGMRGSDRARYQVIFSVHELDAIAGH